MSPEVARERRRLYIIAWRATPAGRAKDLAYRKSRRRRLSDRRSKIKKLLRAGDLPPARAADLRRRLARFEAEWADRKILAEYRQAIAEVNRP